MFSLSYFVTSAFVLTNLFIAPVSGTTCLDEQGNQVSWWSIIKLHGGLTSYGYIDSNTAAYKGPLQLTSKSLDCGKNCALGATLSQIIDDKLTSFRVQWNDELPTAFTSNLRSGTSGHTKGVLSGNQTEGFFLIHSVPKFPDLSGSVFSWGSASTTYGQTFFCMSLDSENIELAANGILFADPLTYDSVMPSGLTSVYPTVTKLIAGQRSEGTSLMNLSTILDNSMVSYFSKSGSTSIDIFENLIQPSLEVDMYVETWRRPPVMDSYCNPPHAWESININNLAFVDENGKEVTFKYTQDHSKFSLAVNSTSQKHWICIGDMNRMTSQWTRGGGMACVRHAALYNPLLASVIDIENCP
jgi:deoxyribonuclease-2